MSLKPLKRDEILRRAQKAERRQNVRLMSPYRYIIFCEGEKTEPNYFGQIKALIERKYRNRVFIEQHQQVDIEIIGTGRSTFSLFDFARAYIADHETTYDYVWLIFDKDDFPQADFDNTIARVKSLTEAAGPDDTRWFCGWSNQCIELWFVLHFEYYHVAHERAHYIQKLNSIFSDKGIGRYKKNMPDIFNILSVHGSLSDAIRNAKNLTNCHDGQTPSNSNPATTVFYLIEDLLPYLDDALQ